MNEESKRPKHMQVFLTTDIKLQSALSFSQYAIQIGTNHRLVTIIGEQHNLAFKCDGADQMSITDYALQTLIRPRTELLLEIDPDFIKTPERWPKSVPIRGILSQAITNPELLARIKGYDWRNKWLGSENREILYYGSETFLGLKKDEVLRLYTTPLTEKWDNFSLVERDYDTNTYLFLSYTFLKNLDDNLKHICARINSKWDLKRAKGEKIAARKGILTMIRHLWKNVTDWNMLRYFFLLSDTNTIVSIMGEQHRQNIASIFSNMTLLAEQSGEENRCISLMKTIYI